MRTARRLYVYLLSGIGLAVLVSGLTLLLSVLHDALGLRGGGEVLGGSQVVRERLTLASAMTAVSLPVWLIHWYLAERSVGPAEPDAQVERDSAIRGLYFALAMGGLLIAAASSAFALTEAAVLGVAGSPDAAYRDQAGSLALLVTAGATWGYHVWLRIRDWRRGPLSGAGAWLPRTYLYAAALGGLLLLLFGMVGLIDVAGRALLGNRVSFGPDDGAWWAYPLASALAQVLVGAALWIGHWWYSLALVADPGFRGSSERPARLRLAYFLGVIAVGAIAVVSFVGEGARQALAAVLDVSDVSGGSLTAAAIALPLLSAVPFAVAWWIHAGWLRDEAVTSDGSERVGLVDRLDDHVVSLVGIAFGAVAAGWLVGLLVDAALGGDRTLIGGSFGQRELAQFVPFALIGGGLWIWRWARIERRRAAAPGVEAAAPIRRASLLIVLALSVLVGVAALGVVLYRFFGTVFGIGLTGDAVSELSRPIGALLTAAAVAAYHGLALRRDQQLRAVDGVSLAKSGPEIATPQRTTPSEPDMTPDASGLILRLSGPPGADLATTVRELQGQLPPGYVLDQLRSGTSA